MVLCMMGQSEFEPMSIATKLINLPYLVVSAINLSRKVTSTRIGDYLRARKRSPNIPFSDLVNKPGKLELQQLGCQVGWREPGRGYQFVQGSNHRLHLGQNRSQPCRHTVRFVILRRVLR